METNCRREYKHHMGLKKLILVGPDGSPLRNTEVVVEQAKHKFLFGCFGGYSSVALANGELDGYSRKIEEERFQKIFDLFNYIVLPFYWREFEMVRGQLDTERMKIAARWVLDNGCVPKGHVLCWHSFTAPWLLELSNTQILSSQIERTEREVSSFAGLIDIWDVINEAVIMPVFKKDDNGITRICKELGRIRTVGDMFSAAKKSNPNATLLINDFVYTTIDSYEILVEGCLEAGIPIDAIGIQSHMHQGYWGVEKTQEILERFSRFNLPIHFTETTLLSGHIMPAEFVDFNDYMVEKWPTTTEGEERQAREVVQLYKTLFAHPAVESITWWEFTDGQWLGAPSGLMTQDNRLKPSYEELHKLIKGEWWTGPFRIATDEAGAITVSGFAGEYQVSCNGKNGRFILEKKMEESVSRVTIY